MTAVMVVVKVVVGMCKQIWHHTLIGFDEFLGTATYEKVDETAATTSAVVAQVPVVVTRKKSKQSSSAAAADPTQEFNGRVTIEVTTRRKLDALWAAIPVWKTWKNRRIR